jgi:hypothetical protein
MPTIHTGLSDIRLGPGEEVDVMACRDACTTDLPVSEPLASTNSLLSDPSLPPCLGKESRWIRGRRCGEMSI